MPKTVLITGSSSGIGKAAAKLFAEKGWNVAATMRCPQKETELADCIALDVTKPETIEKAIAETIKKFGSIDVLVNNAGYALEGLFESYSREQVQKQFDTNIFGLMEVTRQILPQMRKQKSGIIINISSMGGRVAFPLYTLYNATKWALEGFSESLQYELEAVGIRVKLVEPGVIKTDFYERSMDKAVDPNLPDYHAFLTRAKTDLAGSGGKVSTPEEVARVIFEAATDGKAQLRYVVGPDAKQLCLARKILSDKLVFSIIKRVTLS